MKTLFASLIILFSAAFSMQAQSPCHSEGMDTSFEYIESVKVGDFLLVSGNDGGYGNYKNENITIQEGTSIEFRLTPGHPDGSYNEFWKVWIDYNGNDIYEEDEVVVRAKSKFAILHSVQIPTDLPVSNTTMKVVMQYNFEPEACQNVGLGEVEEYTLRFKRIEDQSPCLNLALESFESGYGEWKDGGKDCSIINDLMYEGKKSIRLRDDTSESYLESPLLDTRNNEQLEISFSYMANSFEEGERFQLQLSKDRGQHFIAIKTWTLDEQFENNKIKNENVILENLEEYSIVRFVCIASSNGDHLYLDDIKIDACEAIEVATLQPGLSAANKEEFKNTKDISTSKRSEISTSIYPNPSVGYLRIDMPDVTVSVDFKILLTDLYGNTFSIIPMTEDNQKFALDLTHLKSGTYLISLLDGKKLLKTEKLVLGIQ